MLPFKTGSLGKSPYLAPQLRAFTKADITPSPLINRNPILHQSNRIVTVGLLSSYNNTQRSFARFSAPPIEKTTPPRSALNAEGAPSAKPEKQEIVADEIEAQQPTFFLFNKKKNGDKILRYRYNSTMKNVYIDFASRAESPETPTKFDWSNKTMVRASLQDLGTLLTVLNGNSSSVEIKKTFKDSQTEVLIRLEKDGDDLSVTFTQKKNGSDDQITKFPLSEADVVLLTEFVRCAVRKGLGFS